MKKDSIFWIGYSDLMTSLFFVMFVLFVVTIGYFKKEASDNQLTKVEAETEKEKTAKVLLEKESRIRELTMTVAQQEKLLNIEKQFEPLATSDYFEYLPDCKKYIVKNFLNKELFEPYKSFIKDEFKQETIQVGRAIKDFLEKLNQENPTLSYLLVIEGNTANEPDRSLDQDNNYGYKKSYERALAVYNLWLNNHIKLREYNTEIMLCGSGFNGLCRDPKLEGNNKRFSVQIIPKIQYRSNR